MYVPEEQCIISVLIVALQNQDRTMRHRLTTCERNVIHSMHVLGTAIVLLKENTFGMGITT